MQEENKLQPLKWYKDLAVLKNRLSAGAFLIEGERALAQISESFPGAILQILSTGKLPARYSGYPVRVITESQLKSISNTTTPQGIITVVRLPDLSYSNELPAQTGDKILFMEDIQDPGNVGTLIRTAAAFDFSGVILTGKCADPFSPKCVQSTAGSLLSLWLRRTGKYLKLIDILQDNNYKLVATELKGSEHPSVLQKSRPFILALGNEAAGLSQTILEKADFRLRIPVNQNKAESLNVAISGAICMYLSTVPQ
jgi:TrmH family RNA methyltransferase